MALISVDEREYVTKAIKEGKIRHYEISTYPKFYDEYLASTYLPHKDLKRYPETVELILRLGTHPEIEEELKKQGML
jgi:dTDP-4-amino-4,6-dideoxygalactose transaminase